MTFWQIIRREARKCRKDMRRCVFIFGAALAYLIIFSVLFAPDIIRAVPTVICDEDQSPLSRRLLQRFENNERFSVVAYVSSQEEMQSFLREKKARIALQVPRDFSRAINNGGYSTLLCIVNASNIMPVSAVTTEAENIAENFSNEVALQRTELVTSQTEQRIINRVSPLHTELRVLHNPLQSFTLFYLIGLLVAALQQGIFFATAASVFQEKRTPAVAPFWKLTAGKIVWYVTLGMFSYIMILFLLSTFLHFRLKANLLSVLVAGIIYLFSTASLGLCFASFFPTEMRCVQFSVMYPLAGFILSGFTWPLAAMPPAVQALAACLPQTWFANLLRELFLAGYSPLYKKATLAMLCIGFLCFGINCAWHRRKKGTLYIKT